MWYYKIKKGTKAEIRQQKIVESASAITIPRNTERRTPNDTPADILGSKTPTTPPTNAPTETTTVRSTQKSFIRGSVENNKDEQGYQLRLIQLIQFFFCNDFVACLPKDGDI